MELNKKWLSDQISAGKDNTDILIHFYNLIYLICINRFIWCGLPNNIDVDFIERELNKVGELAFINHKIYGYQITHCTGGQFNLYGRPQRYLCRSVNNVINEWFDVDDIVIIRNNKLSQNTHDFISRYAANLAHIQKVKEVNLNAQKTPVLITCAEGQRLTMQNVYAQYEGNAPVIYVTNEMDIKGVQVLKTDAPYLLDKLQQEKIENFNECLTFLGINTTPRKKERMVTDEVNANNDMVNICLSIFLNTRKQAIKDINEKFGLNIKLELAEFCKDDYIKSEEVIDKREEIDNE